MGETWIICRHVMDGSAEKVELRKDKICLCSLCAEDIDIINTEEVFILDEDRRSADPKDCDGTERRSQKYRRSEDERRETPAEGAQ